MAQEIVTEKLIGVELARRQGKDEDHSERRGKKEKEARKDDKEGEVAVFEESQQVEDGGEIVTAGREEKVFRPFHVHYPPWLAQVLQEPEVFNYIARHRARQIWREQRGEAYPLAYDSRDAYDATAARQAIDLELEAQRVLVHECEFLCCKRRRH